MRNTLNAITQTMRKVIRRIYPPFRTSSSMSCLVLGNAVGGDIPHLRIGIVDILLHAKPSGLWLVIPISHGAEFGQVGCYSLLSVFTSVPRCRIILSATLQLCLCLVAVTDVGLFFVNQQLCEIVQTLKVV